MTTAITSQADPSTLAPLARVDSELFGTLSVPEDVCIAFEQGLLGFGGSQRFVLLPADPEGVYWLQGVDDGSLVFLVIDPFRYVPGYSVSLTDVDRSIDVTKDETEMAVLGIVTLPRSKKETCTVNLQAPLIIDFATRRGSQLVLAECQYGTRHPVDITTTEAG